MQISSNLSKWKRVPARRLGFIVLTAAILGGTGAGRADSLVLWNRLGSETEILNSAVGPNLEFYTGGDGMEAGAWTHDMGKARLVLDAPGRLGMTGSVWVPGLKRYLMIGWYYPGGGGVMPGASKETVCATPST